MPRQAITRTTQGLRDRRTTTNKEKTMPRQAITRTTQGLRDRLFDLLDDLKEGDATPQEAQATARVVQQIHNTARLEMEAARFVSASQTVNGKKDGVLELEPLRLSKF
jgi:hypothetical protein